MTRAAFLLALVTAFPRITLGQPAAVSGRPETSHAPSRRLALYCSPGSRPDITAARLRAAIERELGVQVELSPDSGGSPLKISVEAPNAARVRFLNERGVSIERNVELPADTARAVEVITWVAGNLARDEAASLIEQYRARTDAVKADAAGEAAEARPPPSPPPAPAPAPTRPVTPPTKPAKIEPRSAASAGAERSYRSTLLNLSLFHPLALHRDSAERRFTFELGLVYGRIGALRGFGLELGLLSVEGPLEGVMFGGALDVNGDTTGYTGTAFYSGGRNLNGVDTTLVAYRRGAVKGGELTAIFARAERVDGVIVGGAATIATDVRGAQLAAGANISHSVQGVTAAAGANVSGRVEGVALAAGANLSRELTGVTAAAGANLVDRVEGASLAGGLNLSRDVNGLQIGIVNVGGRVRGAQIGVVNVASEMNGAGIGVVSIAGNGEVAANAWVNDFAPLHASIKFRSGYAYSEIGVGLDPSSDEYLLESGAGAHIPIAGPIALEPGIHHSITKHTDQALDEGRETDRLHYRLRGLYRLGRRFDLFAGGGVRHAAWGDDVGDVDPEVFAGVSVH